MLFSARLSTGTRRFAPPRRALLTVWVAAVVTFGGLLTLSQTGVAHERPMDLFLGHVSVRNLTLFLVAAAAVAVSLVSLDRIPDRHRPGPLHANINGDGSPVVLVHGLGASSRYWEPVTAALGDQHRVVAVDLLGYGRSPKPSDVTYDVDCHVNALTPHVPEGSVIVAHSTGAVIALRLAARHPDVVAGLVLIAPPAYPDADTARERISESGTLARLTAHEHLAARVLCGAMCLLRPLAAAGAPVIARDMPARVAADGVLHTWPSYSRTLQRVVIDHRLDDDLASTSAPIRLLVGANDAVSTPASIAAALERTGRDPTELDVIDGEDHHLALHRPGLVADAVAHVEAAAGTPS